MANSRRVNAKKRGRPKTTGKGELIGVRILPPLLKELDAWIGGQKPRPSRPEAIRRFLERALARSSNDRSTSKQKAQKASELADHAAEHIVNKSMPPEEQERRKRAIVRGPKEFRDIREDLPKSRA
jgi:metal-responsive CopG/Arc/MetJ family transcriptional regulator